MTPFPIILSAPSGAGKTSIARALLAARSDVGYSVSATTRPRRGHEVEGKDYHFLSDDDFRRKRAAGEFAESAEVHGRWYGTLRREVDAVLGAGKHVIMAIDVQGARQFARAYPNSVRVFVLPPSVEVLIERLRARNTESDDLIDRRLRTAQQEIEAVGEYDYVVVNDQLSVVTKEVSGIIDAELKRVPRATPVNDTISALLADLRRAIAAHV
ncbi:MAG TPA: guanylate kinase [Gemmatimonadaceae bacterium]|nr:guanylate kinase [Gemmatimonadaceae bacterium]